jgi:hypothetical protein
MAQKFGQGVAKSDNDRVGDDDPLPEPGTTCHPPAKSDA